MIEERFDLLVVGSGPAGQKAAIGGAKLGKTTVLVEAGVLGGSSLTFGTIPSKTLREAILQLTNFTRQSFYASSKHAPSLSEITINELNYQVAWVQTHLKETIQRQLDKNGVHVMFGFAKFVDPHRMHVFDEEGRHTHSLFAEKIILTIGSRPRKPEGITFDGKHIFDSNQLLKLDHIPRSLIVIGAGVIGSEYASMFSVLGVKVHLIDKHARLLHFLDREVGAHLQLSLEESKLQFHGKKEYTSIRMKGENMAVVSFRDGTELEAEAVLVAAGRVCNIDLLDAENAGFALHASGVVEVNEKFQTCVPHIYAAGDVIGGPSLSSTGYQQGRLAALHAFHQPIRKTDTISPYGIYTIPEVSTIGMTEEELIDAGLEYAIGRAYFYEVSRSIISGSESGLCKILFHPKNLSIYGVHIVGHGATEIIHIAQAAMTFNATIEYFLEEVFNFPTYAEMYKIAAQNGLNKVKR